MQDEVFRDGLTWVHDFASVNGDVFLLAPLALEPELTSATTTKACHVICQAAITVLRHGWRQELNFDQLYFTHRHR